MVLFAAWPIHRTHIQPVILLDNDSFITSSANFTNVFFWSCRAAFTSILDVKKNQFNPLWNCRIIWWGEWNEKERKKYLYNYLWPVSILACSILTISQIKKQQTNLASETKSIFFLNKRRILISSGNLDLDNRNGFVLLLQKLG